MCKSDRVLGETLSSDENHLVDLFQMTFDLCPFAEIHGLVALLVELLSLQDKLYHYCVHFTEPTRKAQNVTKPSCSPS